MDQVKFEMAKKGERIHRLRKSGQSQVSTLWCARCVKWQRRLQSLQSLQSMHAQCRGEKGSWRFGGRFRGRLRAAAGDFAGFGRSAITECDINQGEIAGFAVDRKYTFLHTALLSTPISPLSCTLHINQKYTKHPISNESRIWELLTFNNWADYKLTRHPLRYASPIILSESNFITL